MLYHNVRVMGYYLRFIDAASIGVASAATWWVGSRLDLWHQEQTVRAAFVFSLVIVVAFAALGGRMRAYHARRTEQVWRELNTLFEVALYSAALACLASVTVTPGAPGLMYLTTLATGAATLLGGRLLMRIVIRRLRRRGKEYRTWLIVGHNERAARIAEQTLANPHFGILLEEIADLPNKPGCLEPDRQHFMRKSSALVPCRVVQDVEAIREIVGSRVIDEVVITLPVRSFYDEVQQILDICCEAGISVRLPPEAFDRAGHRMEVVNVGEIPMVTHFTGPSNHRLLLVKRIIDVCGSTIGLLLSLPLFAVIALAIKLTSQGSIFFMQTRVGLHGRLIKIIKFRSMVHDAPVRREELAHFNETDGVAFKIKHDPRITRVGRIIRKFHLDELPQLWNVLIGDMSLVGPRPLPPNEANGNEWWQRRRLSMPPGLTCFWQVKGDHSMPFRQWVQLDLNYIDRWSVWLDFKLMASTLPTLLRGKGW